MPLAKNLFVVCPQFDPRNPPTRARSGRMSTAEALSAAKEAVLSKNSAAIEVVREFAIACGKGRPEAGTVKAIRAVIERMADVHRTDKEAYEANGCSRTSFKDWKRTINSIIVDSLDVSDLDAVSTALGESVDVLPAPPPAIGSPVPSVPPSAPTSSLESSSSLGTSATSDAASSAFCMMNDPSQQPERQVIPTSSNTGVRSTAARGKANMARGRELPTSGTVVIYKQQRKTTVGIQLTGVSGTPRISKVYEGSIASKSTRGSSTNHFNLCEGAWLVKVNGITISGHAQGSRMLREAVGVVKLELSLEEPQSISDTTPTNGQAPTAQQGVQRVQRQDLRSAVNKGHKEPANPSPSGEQRWRYTWHGVVYVTDITSQHEITSWRDDGKDIVPPPPPRPDAYGVHVVMIVDHSGSMRKDDVEGFDTRLEAVYDCLLRDLVEPQLSLGFYEEDGNAVASLIKFDSDASILLERVPFDAALLGKLKHLRSRRAGKHGNYMSGLARAIELLERSRKDARLLVIFLSDGAPSDHVSTCCRHGVHVWQEEPTGSVNDSGKPVTQLPEDCTNKSRAPQSPCRQYVQDEIRKVCKKRVKAFGTMFGVDRVKFAAIGFGTAGANFRLLESMAQELPKGSFHQLGLRAGALRTVFSSLSSSLTTLRTEAAGSRPMTLRNISVRPENDNNFRTSSRVNGDGWYKALFGQKYVYSAESDMLVTVPLENGATVVAFRKVPFASGAERFAFRGSEVAVPDEGDACRVGSWLVTKQSKYEELLFDLEFHKTFCRLHCQADSVAKVFTASVIAASPQLSSAFAARYVQCVVYKLMLNEQKLHVLAEPELEGKYIKYNNNAGGIRAASSSMSSLRSGHTEALNLYSGG